MELQRATSNLQGCRLWSGRIRTDARDGVEMTNLGEGTRISTLVSPLVCSGKVYIVRSDLADGSGFCALPRVHGRNGATDREI